jgi:hypothetical protein
MKKYQSKAGKKNRINTMMYEQRRFGTAGDDVEHVSEVYERSNGGDSKEQLNNCLSRIRE